MKLLIFSLHCFLLVFLACNQDIARSQSTVSNMEPASRSDLYQELRSNRKITFIYSEGLETYRSVLDSISYPGSSVEKKIIPSNEVKPETLSNDILFLIGSPQSNPVIQSFSSRLPIKFEPYQFKFDYNIYTDTEDIIKLHIYPNPNNPKLPLYLLSGNSDEAILSFIKKKYLDQKEYLYQSNHGYEVLRNQQAVVAGSFNDSTWALDKVIHFDFTSKVDTLLQTEHFNFLGNIGILNNDELQEIAQNCEASYAKINAFISPSQALPKINYHFYSSMEMKGLQLSNTTIAHCDINKNCVFVVKEDHIHGPAEHMENMLILRKLLGKPELMAFDWGLSRYFNNEWQNFGFRHWAKRLQLAGLLPGLDELLDNKQIKILSPFVREPAAAALVDMLIKEWGKEKFLRQYKSWKPDQKQLKKWKTKWQKHVEQYALNLAPSKAEKQHPYYKGFNFAHEGYRIYNGYGSRLAKQSLLKLSELGTNSVAIVPYSFMRNPNQATPLNISHGPGGENDESIITAHYNAKKMGMLTLLKPQIWLGSSWPGEVEMDSEEDWQLFFKYYTDWIIHYALIAEMYGFDALCLGVEFAKATIQKPEEWKSMIEKIRGIYSGKITYAANWGEEFENLSFWSELDFIGLNCYYPLSESDTPTKNELKKQFTQVMQKAAAIAQQFNKPLVFTEIGFRSVSTPWKNPHASADNRPINEDAQKLCYEVVFEGIKDVPWCDGIFWWKWPSYLSYGGKSNSSFTPNNKAAEKTVKEWFTPTAH